MMNKSNRNKEETKQPIIRFEKIEISDDEDKDSDDSSHFEPPPMRENMRHTKISKFGERNRC